MQNQENKTIHVSQTAVNTPMLPKSSHEDFGDLCENKKYSAAIYAGVIVGTNPSSLEKTGFRRFNPNFAAFGKGEILRNGVYNTRMEVYAPSLLRQYSVYQKVWDTLLPLRAVRHPILFVTV